MKKDLIIGVAIGLVVGACAMAFISPKKSVASGIVVALPEISNLNDDYLVKVENFGISVEDFTNAYEVVKRNMPPQQRDAILANEGAAKAEILETMINQYAIVATAMEEGFLENPANMQLFRNAAYQALFNLYLSQNIPTDGNAFAASQPEIDQVYAQYGAQFRANGMNAQQIQEYIVAQISQQKQQRWMMEFVTKIKESYRVERNASAIEKQQISTSGLAFPPVQ